MNNVLDLSNYIMTKNELTPKQLQKILYFAYAIYLRKYNDKYSEKMNTLFNEQIQAWEHGPVIKEVYDKYKLTAYANQRMNTVESDSVDKISLKDRNFIDKVVGVFSKFTGYELEKMTHNEEPWKTAFSRGINSTITNEMIYNYYSKAYKKDSNGIVYVRANSN